MVDKPKFQQESSTSIINTPGTDKVDQYPMALALSVAYRDYYSKRYLELGKINQPEKVNGVAINRPLHGLAHITECLAFLSPTIALFAKHAKDRDMQEYCKSMSPEELEFLTLLVIFKNTGREGEVDFRDPKYDLYKKYSADNFADYARKNTNLSWQKIDEGCELIRERAHPYYKNDDPIMLYRVRIIDLNHDLDLRRLYGEVISQDALNKHLEFLKLTREMAQDYQLVQDFAVKTIAAMGSVNNVRRAPFDVFSTRMAVADEMLNHVPNGIPSAQDTEKFVKIIQGIAGGPSKPQTPASKPSNPTNDDLNGPIKQKLLAALESGNFSAKEKQLLKNQIAGLSETILQTLQQYLDVKPTIKAQSSLFPNYSGSLLPVATQVVFNLAIADKYLSLKNLSSANLFSNSSQKK